MKRIIQKTGGSFLTILYCLALCLIHANNSYPNQPLIDLETQEEFKVDVLAKFNSHTFEYNPLYKSSEKRVDQSDQKRIQNLYFHNFSLTNVLTNCLEVEKRSKEDIPLCFSQTDIIFPFHFFW